MSPAFCLGCQIELNTDRNYCVNCINELTESFHSAEKLTENIQIIFSPHPIAENLLTKMNAPYLHYLNQSLAAFIILKLAKSSFWPTRILNNSPLYCLYSQKQTLVSYLVSMMRLQTISWKQLKEGKGMNEQILVCCKNQYEYNLIDKKLKNISFYEDQSYFFSINQY